MIHSAFFLPFHSFNEGFFPLCFRVFLHVLYMKMAVCRFYYAILHGDIGLNLAHKNQSIAIHNIS